MSANLSTTYGAVTIGALSASLLSGAVAIQTILYYKLYPSDSIRVKILVFAVWLLDLSHTCFVWVSLWDMIISDYGRLDTIPWSPPLRSTCRRLISAVSKRNWFLTCPIVSGPYCCLTTSEMLRLKTYSAFKADFRWVFTLGLALSSAVDILITGSLFGLLRTSRSDAENLKAVIDSLILYTFETGSLTCAATIIDMICWITMSSNLIFMGLHFVIGKLYANSLLVT
ncbi:hypothetical protein IW262DRAFT_1559753 [Armillaria fumosa]|nr:hypothetical protein IW262DRAFT_1559753 [Armillaria fumosa]